MSKQDAAAAAAVEAAAEQESAEQAAELEQATEQVKLGDALMGHLDNLGGKLWLVVGVQVDRIKSVLDAQRLPLKPYCEGIIPRTWSTVNKARQAGEIARLLELEVPTWNPDDIGSLDGIREQVGRVPSYLQLLPFARMVSAAKTPQELAKAHADIRRVWKDLVEKNGGEFPSVEQVEARAGRFAGAAGRKPNEQEPNEQDRNEPTGDSGDAHETITLEVDPTALESASKIVDSFVRQAKREHGIESDVTRAIMLGTLRLQNEHDRSTLLVVLGAVSAEPTPQEQDN